MTAKNLPRRRIGLPSSTVAKKVRTTIVLPVLMLDSIHTAMDNQGVPRKRRSRWIEAAVCALFEIVGYEELAREEFIEPGGNKVISVSLSVEVKARVDGVARKLSLDAEQPVTSGGLFRTAISQCLIRASRAGQ